MTYLRHLFVFCKYLIVTPFRDFGETLFSGFYFSDLSVLYFTILYKPQCYSRIPSPGKVIAHWKNITIFHVFDIAISYWHVTCFWRQSVRMMSEWQSLHHSLSKVVCWNFFTSWLLKHLEICMAYGKWSSNFPGGGGGGRKAKYNFFFIIAKTRQINT